LALHLQQSTSSRRQCCRNDNITLEIDQLRRQLGKQFSLAERKAVHYSDVLPLYMLAEFDQTFFQKPLAAPTCCTLITYPIDLFRLLLLGGQQSCQQSENQGINKPGAPKFHNALI